MWRIYDDIIPDSNLLRKKLMKGDNVGVFVALEQRQTLFI